MQKKENEELCFQMVQTEVQLAPSRQTDTQNTVSKRRDPNIHKSINLKKNYQGQETYSSSAD